MRQLSSLKLPLSAPWLPFREDDLIYIKAAAANYSHGAAPGHCAAVGLVVPTGLCQPQLGGCLCGPGCNGAGRQPWGPAGDGALLNYATVG